MSVDNRITESDDRRYSPLLRYSSAGFDDDVRASEDHSDEGRQRPRYLTQVFVTVTTCLAVQTCGMTMGYTSPAGPMLQNEGILDETQSSWFGSVLSFGAISGAPLAGFAVNRLGRKLTIMLCALPYTIGWLIVIATVDYSLLLTGRILTGIGIGMATVVIPIYTAEVLSKDVRGILGAFFQASACIGIFAVYFLGIWLSWRWLAVASALPVALMVVLMIFVPETPRWLVSKGKYNEAIQSLKWLRGPHYYIDKELDDIHENQTNSNTSLTLQEVVAPKLYRPLLLGLGLMVFQQLSGINAVIFNTSTIFQTAGFGNHSSVPAVIIGAVQLISSICSCILMDRAGRKILLLISSVFMVISCVSFGVFYYYYKELHHNNLQWLSLTSMVIYIVAFFLGWGPVPWLMLGEIYPVKAKGLACTLGVMINWGFCFLVTKEYLDLTHYIHDYGTFWFYAFVNFISIFFVIFCVPETKGKTLEEIELYFDRETISNTSGQSINYATLD